MMRARRTGRNRYEITRDGRRPAPLVLGGRRSGASFDVGGGHYDVRPTGPGSYDLLTADGATAATAERLDRHRWGVRAGGRVHHLRRESRRELSLLDGDGRLAGSVTRTGWRRSDVAADLPGLDEPVRVFAVAVLLLRWRRRRVRTATVLGTTAGG